MMDPFDYMDEHDKCLLLTDGFSRFIQMLLGVCAIGVLFIKREIEIPKREFNVWTFDVSKQGLGALFVHIVNIFLSILLTQRSKADDDQCAVYFVTFLIDVSLGTYMLVILAQIKAFAKWIGWTSIVTSGEYGNPPQFVVWLKQFSVYLVSLIAMKVVVTILVYILYIPLATGSTYIFSIFSHHRHAELVVVMILGPCVVNIIQFWVLDNYLKHAVTGPPASPTFARVPSIDDLIDENHPHTPLLL
ncbi:hypothetical protein H310_14603 [Aphanomyces invadans]|uniref:Uncharacterized protein n=1 Tax=Aphanomyces invadans TaxID=157072 RepID=A0A024T912_9STRA|nr:hypothetical protein H310_14603 [Aphanomyces invadans]ETV90645.1 hypothetical protein H310_14603 [Aphanomyces invadans]|eukprot:XP_008880715.1 hypothetical protein H310_14603 [Aphanomyces invadans]